MKMQVGVFVVASLFANSSLLFAASDEKDEVVKKDMEAMKGAWTVISVEKDGKKYSDEQLNGLTVRVDLSGKTSGYKGDKPIFEGIHKIDPTKEPKWIDASQTSEGENKGKTLLGIYDVKGDSMRICVADPGSDRPTEFSSKPGSGRSLRVYKRKKD